MNEEENKVTTTIEFELKVKERDKATGELVDAMVLGSKMTKADSGRVGYNEEEWLSIAVEADEKDRPKVVLNSHSKMTKADSAKA